MLSLLLLDWRRLERVGVLSLAFGAGAVFVVVLDVPSIAWEVRSDADDGFGADGGIPAGPSTTGVEAASPVPTLSASLSPSLAPTRPLSSLSTSTSLSSSSPSPYTPKSALDTPSSFGTTPS